MAKKGQKLSAQSIENIRNGQLARWAKIKAKVASGEQHEALCDAVETTPNIAMPSLDPNGLVNRVINDYCEWSRNGQQANYFDPADDQHIIDTCMPRCNKTSFWSRLKNIFI